MAAEDEGGVFAWRVSDRQYVRYDARGHGATPAGASAADHAWDSLAADLLARLDGWGFDRAVVGGASMGAATTLHAAVAAPHRVAAMVLAIPPTAWATRPRQARLYRAGASLVDKLGSTVLARAQGLAPTPAIYSGPLAALPGITSRAIERSDSRTLARVLRGAAASDLPPPEVVRTLTQPTLILAWATDRGHPVSTAKRLAELLPAAELHVARTPEAVLAWPELVEAFLTRAP